MLVALTLCALFLHGYHPFAEDGGLYVAGIEYRLDPSLFPHNTAFVAAHTGYSVFASVLAGLVDASHFPLIWILLVVYLSGIYATLYAALRLARCSHLSGRTALFAVGLLTATLTVPIAGTSLLLLDPYVTARTFSTPLALLSISFLLEAAHRPQLPACVRAIICVLTAAAFHPLMAAYAACFLIALLIARARSFRAQMIGWTISAITAVAIAALIQTGAQPESPSGVVADISRYYWFLSEWQWFEVLGLAGPCLVVALAGRFYARRDLHTAAALCRAGIGLGAIACLIAVLFAQQHLHVHAVARLQPLRAFLVVYAVMVIMLGGVLSEFLTTRRNRVAKFAPQALLLMIAGLMFYTQRQTFPASQHLELPWRSPTNLWTRAFLWARENTTRESLFALDANYIMKRGEDAQTFRATALRSALADFSKDGGEAAITPPLAEAWLIQSTAQKGLSLLDDEARDAKLRPFKVTWMVLESSASTLHPCPYNNGAVKVCSNSQPPQPGPPLP